MRVAAVLFDAGGVLLDLDYAYLGRVFRAHGAAVDDEKLARVEAAARFEVDRSRRAGEPAGDWRDFFYLLLGRLGVAPGEHDAIIDTLWEAHQRVGLWTVAAPEGPETVARLRRAGLRTAVVSNAEGQVARDLDLAGYRGMFDTVVDSHIVGVRKPAPEIFRIALEHLAVDAARAVYVGDIPAIDVAGARAAGIGPVLLDRHGLYEDGDAPRIRSIGELPALLQNSAA
jgi:putative hydrolase of the HAD superfamily